MGTMILITGGARSGKSRYALNRALDISDTRTFVATCPVLDCELAERIKRHKAEREGQGWQTIEEQTNLPAAITAAQSGLAVVDCLTLWMNNLMHEAKQAERSFGEDDTAKACQNVIRAVRSFEGSVILVANEVGMGITPDNALSRQFRDNVGRSNQVLAAAANEVVFVVSGLPLIVKPE